MNFKKYTTRADHFPLIGDMREKKKEKHYMSFYAIPLELSVHRKEKTIWTHSNELPEVFPIESQKPLNTGISPEVIDSLIQK